MVKANHRNEDLDRHLQRTIEDLTTARTAAWASSTSVFNIQGSVSIRTLPLEYSVRNAVAVDCLSVDGIHNSTGGASKPVLHGAQLDGAKNAGETVLEMAEQVLLQGDLKL